MSTTTTASIPCPECGEAHVCKPRGIDPESLTEWTLCEIESGSYGTFYYEVRLGHYRIGSADVDRRVPASWRIVRTIPTGDNVVELKPTEVVVSIEGLRKDVLRRLAQSDESEPYADSYAYRTLTRVAQAAQAAGLLDEEA